MPTTITPNGSVSSVAGGHAARGPHAHRVGRRARHDGDNLANDAGQYELGVELKGQIEGVSTEETRALMQAAHEVCPYSKATRGNIDVKLVAE